MLRQLAVAGLGHDGPTVLITNDPDTPTKKVIEAYARRMNIEQRFAEAIRAFSLDALAGALSPQRRPRRRAGPCWPTPSAPRCVAACPATPRRFLSTGGVILIRQRDRRPAQPADLLTDPAPSRPAHHRCPQVGRTTATFRAPLTRVELAA